MADRKNPLATLWNLMGTVGGILSLSSMAQNWANDFVQWHHFLGPIFQTYRQFTDWLFVWVPFDIWNWVKDYLVLGVLFVAAALRAWGVGEPKPPLITYVVVVLTWPVFFGLSLLKLHRERVEENKHFGSWVLAIVLGVVMLLAFNQFVLVDSGSGANPGTS